MTFYYPVREQGWTTYDCREVSLSVTSSAIMFDKSSDRIHIYGITITLTHHSSEHVKFATDLNNWQLIETIIRSNWDKIQRIRSEHKSYLEKSEELPVRDVVLRPLDSEGDGFSAVESSKTITSPSTRHFDRNNQNCSNESTKWKLIRTKSNCTKVFD